jgi:hypothetical protein
MDRFGSLRHPWQRLLYPGHLCAVDLSPRSTQSPVLAESFVNLGPIFVFEHWPAASFSYHQCSAWMPYVSPAFAFPNDTPPTRPRNPFDQLA